MILLLLYITTMTFIVAATPGITAAGFLYYTALYFIGVCLGMLVTYTIDKRY